MLIGRIILQALIIALPFVVFGLYLYATRSAEEAGRRKWPIQLLFVIGLALTTIVWFAAILMEPRERDVCTEPARFESGVLIPARTYPCERKPEDVGVPSSRRGTAPADAPD
ncbi:hypothetical protein [Hyphomonas sp.]|uniref:hypothetical protein n=1 Tax=Hyphomonas sp. TaxID=87 RepID=UPI00391D6842